MNVVAVVVICVLVCILCISAIILWVVIPWMKDTIEEMGNGCTTCEDEDACVSDDVDLMRCLRDIIADDRIPSEVRNPAITALVKVLEDYGPEKEIVDSAPVAE